MDKAQHSAGKDLLDSVRLGDLPGIGMTIIDGDRAHAQKPQHAAGDYAAGVGEGVGGVGLFRGRSLDWKPL